MTFAAAPATRHVADGDDGAGDLEGPLAQREARARRSAAKASLRSPIGTVPAWPDAPRKVTVKPAIPAIAATSPSGMSAASSIGPCSMCTSTYAPGSADIDRRPGQPERGERLGRRDAGGVALGEVAGADVAHDAAAAEAPVAEPPPLLVAEDDDGERGRRAGRAATAATASSAATHAQRSVEAAAGRDRVEVRAGPDLGARAAPPGRA